MGQILSSPITTKHSTEGKDARLSFGASSMQGWRISKLLQTQVSNRLEINFPCLQLAMEDAHTHILDYENTGASFFAVFDGHGGECYIYRNGRAWYQCVHRCQCGKI